MSVKTKDLTSHRWRLLGTAIVFGMLFFSAISKADTPPTEQNAAIDAYFDSYVGVKQKIYLAEKEYDLAKQTLKDAEKDNHSKEKLIERAKKRQKDLDENPNITDDYREKENKLIAKDLEVKSQAAYIQGLKDALATAKSNLEEAKKPENDISDDQFSDKVSEFKALVHDEKKFNDPYNKALGVKDQEIHTKVDDRTGKLRRKYLAQAEAQADIEFSKNHTKQKPVPDVIVKKDPQLPPPPSPPTPPVEKPKKPVVDPGPPANCKDLALKEITQNLAKNHSDVLGKLFNLTAMKMAYNLQNTPTGKQKAYSSVEDYYTRNKKTITAGLNDPTFTETLKKAYAEYGKADDIKAIQFAKQRYLYKAGHSEWRVTNDNASALVYWLSQDQAKKATPALTDFTEMDAATVWAVEKIKRSKANDPSYATGKLEGNLLNFSTRVVNAMKTKVDTASVQTESDAVDQEIKDAAAQVSANLKKCQMSSDCPGSTPLSLDTVSVKAIQKDLVQQVLKEQTAGTVSINAAKTTVDPDGKITISLDPPDAKK